LPASVAESALPAMGLVLVMGAETISCET